MSRIKTASERAAGKLISSIQKEWGKELGETTCQESEMVMDKGHELLQARNSSEMKKVLDGKTLEAFLGATWVQAHPNVFSAIEHLTMAIQSEET